MKRRISEQDYRKSKIQRHVKQVYPDGTVHEWACGGNVYIDFDDEVPYYTLTRYSGRTGKNNFKT